MIISHTVVPNGGWVYVTDKGIRLVAETFDLLISNVKAYNINNGIPMEDVVSEVEKQLAKNHPELKKHKVLA